MEQLEPDDIRDLTRWAVVLTPDFAYIDGGIQVRPGYDGMFRWQNSPVWQRHMRYLESKAMYEGWDIEGKSA